MGQLLSFAVISHDGSGHTIHCPCDSTSHEHFSYCSAENVYCVTPTATSCSSCPHNSTHNATLSEYAQEAKMYFTSNTTMVFLPGDHVLDRIITVTNVTRLTMHGESSSGNIATVVRNVSVGFSFTNMVDVTIYSLAFTSYNRSMSYGRHPASNTALRLQSSQYAKLVHCFFHDNLGNGLTVYNTSITLVENEFTHNQCGCDLRRCKLGCGITAHNSTLVNKFKIDNGNSHGGALYLFISSTISILPNTTVSWESNHAHRRSYLHP